jgi:hypothetical protein
MRRKASIRPSSFSLVSIYFDGILPHYKPEETRAKPENENDSSGSGWQAGKPTSWQAGRLPFEVAP